MVPHTRRLWDVSSSSLRGDGVRPFEHNSKLRRTKQLCSFTSLGSSRSYMAVGEHFCLHNKTMKRFCFHSLVVETEVFTVVCAWVTIVHRARIKCCIFAPIFRLCASAVQRHIKNVEIVIQYVARVVCVVVGVRHIAWVCSFNHIRLGT